MPDFPSSTSASGIWQMRQVKRAVQGGNWPPLAIPDPYFEYVSLLLPGNGTNGAQNNTFLDSSTNNFTITRNGNTTQGTFTPYGANWSNYFNNSTGLGIAYGTATHTFWNNDFTLEFWVNGPVKTYSTVLSSWFNSNFDGSSWAVAISNGVPALSNRSSSGTNQAPFITAGSTRVDDGLWHQVVITQVTGANKTFRLFVDGVLRGYKVETNWTQGSANSTIYIGTQGPGTFDEAGRYLLGYLSNLRLTTSIVSAYSTSSTTLGTTIFTPPTAPLSVTAGTNILTCADNRFIDDSTNNFPITRLGDVSTQRFSPFNPTAAYSASTIGGSGYFDGSGDYLSATNSGAFDMNTSFTAEAWVYQTASGATGGVMGVGGGAANWSTSNGHEWLLLSNYSGTLYFQYNANGSPGQITATGAPLNQWNHIAVGYNGTTASVWLNGTRVGTASISVTLPTTRNIFTTGNISALDAPMTGYISSARVVRGTDVYGVSNSTITVPTAPLTAITNTSLLLNFTNAGIIDNAMMNDLETVGNAQISTSVSKFGGGSIAFDGTGDYLSALDNPALEGFADFTIEFWLNLNSIVNGTCVLSKGWSASASNYSPYLFYVSGTNLALYASSNGSTWDVSNNTTITSLATGQWYYIAVSRSGSSLRVFANGSLVTTVTNGTALMSNTSALTVGADAAGGSAINGYIDDLRITRGYARYTSSFSAPTAPFPTL